jgi:hypothetical protein
MKTVKRLLKALNPRLLVGAVMVRFCSVFGHTWVYSFTCSDAHNKECNIRRCKVCGKLQHHKQIASFQPNGEWVWMNMISYTKLGAKNRWS